MQLTFLQADVPLTKKFEKTADGALNKDSYPFVKNFTSHTENVDTVQEFHAALVKQSLLKYCLLKGNVSKPLIDESRAGSTDPIASTRWVVFDVDGLNNVSDPEVFIHQVLPKEFHNVSYVLQHSASSGISGDGMRAHLFFLTTQEVSPGQVKTWLQVQNLQQPLLSTQIRLTASKMALSWPLDITVCQNDKLIYIAPPICVGFDDPLQGERIILVEKEHEKVLYQFPMPLGADPRALADAKVQELRVATGLPKKKIVYKVDPRDGIEYIDNPDTGAAVTGEKEMNGFIRINLNGGDSWAYFYTPENPKYLYNFKGEPVVKIKMFLPDYYRDVVVGRKKKISSESPRPFAFRDPTGDTYYFGMRTPEGNVKDLHAIGSKDKIEDAYALFGEAPPDPIPHWRRIFDPTDDRGMNEYKLTVNIWRPNQFMTDTHYVPDIPPTIDRVIRHVLNNDRECYNHFLNWIAYIFQKRTKTGTAWVLHGTQGTGKGVLFNHILKPIFGDAYCTTRLLKDISDNFNDFMEYSILLNVDEARIKDDQYESSRIVNQLKSWITEPEVIVRGMRMNQRTTRSFTNFIFASNEYDAIRIAEDDRRFNVAPRQEERIEITPREISVDIPKELRQAANFLASYAVDHDMAHRAIHNAAKTKMRKASQTSVEQFAEAFITGDLDYLVDGLEEDPTTNVNDFTAAPEFKLLVLQWVDDYRNGVTTLVQKKEAFIAYKALFNPRNDMLLKKFTRMMEHKNLTFDERPMIYGERKLGRVIEWQVAAGVEQAWILPPKLTVVEGNKDAMEEIKRETV